MEEVLCGCQCLLTCMSPEMHMQEDLEQEDMGGGGRECDWGMEKLEQATLTGIGIWTGTNIKQKGKVFCNSKRNILYL